MPVIATQEFRNYMAAVFLAAALVAPSTCAVAEDWIRQERYSEFHVVTSPHRTTAEARAAEEFSHYWEALTGHRPSQGEGVLYGKVNVWIGDAGSPHSVQEDLEGLSEDGFIVRTVHFLRSVKHRSASGLALSRHFSETDHLIIEGGGPRGTIYAVYQFFEDYLGVRWLTPELTHLPPPPQSLPHVDLRYDPPFQYRDVSYRTFVNHPEFAMAHRLNGFWMKIPPEWGGNISYARGRPGLGHTFYLLAPRRKYFKDHPEYYSEVDGARIFNMTQLCLTNPDVLRIVTEGVRQWLRDAAPTERIVSVSQMDWGNWCTCKSCAALDDHEESHSGTIIHFVNAIAEAIEEEFPQAFIDTFAYQYSRKSPKHVRPRDNVIVRLTSLECDFSTPLSDPRSSRNTLFRQDLEGWSAITKNLFIWDYTQNWYSFQGPHPNIHVLQPNAKFYRDHGAKGLFEQASPLSPHSDFEHLKAYIVAHAVWDPDADWRALYDEFLRLYYKDAAPYIDEYLQLITRRVRRRDVVMTMFNPISWMDSRMVEKAEAIFERAFDHVKDEDVIQRLKYAHLPLQYAALVCSPVERFEGDRYVLSRPASQSFDAYWAMLHRYGVSHLADWPIAKFKERLRGATPARYAEIPVEKIENEFYECWVVPSMGGKVIRFFDKTRRRDLLEGFQKISTSTGSLGLWLRPSTPGPYGPDPIAEPFDVLERSGNHLRMEATLESGLHIEEELTLADASKELEMTIRLRNDGAEPLRPFLEIRASAWTRRSARAQVWIQEGSTWERWPSESLSQRNGATDSRSAQGIAALAFYSPKEDLSLINRVKSGKTQTVEYYINFETRRMDLRVHPLNESLDPGQGIALKLVYRTQRGAPSASPQD